MCIVLVRHLTLKNDQKYIKKYSEFFHHGISSDYLKKRNMGHICHVGKMSVFLY